MPTRRYYSIIIIIIIIIIINTQNFVNFYTIACTNRKRV